MHNIQLADQVYTDIRRAAALRGCETVEAYIAEVVREDLRPETFDHLFTPDRLERIDMADADVKSGEFFTTTQLEAALDADKAEWRKKNLS